MDSLARLGSEVRHEVLAKRMTEDKKMGVIRRIEGLNEITTPLEVEFDYQLGLRGRALIQTLVWTMMGLTAFFFTLPEDYGLKGGSSNGK